MGQMKLNLRLFTADDNNLNNADNARLRWVGGFRLPK